MEMLEEFKILKANLLSSPTFSSYSAICNFAKKNEEELKLKKVKISVLRNFTVESILPMIIGELVMNGISPEIYVNDFDTIPEKVLNQESDFYQSKPDYILICQWLEILSPKFAKSFLTLSSEQVDEEISRISHLVESFFKSIRAKTAAPILINNFPLPTYTSLGILDVQNNENQTYSILKLNLEILKISKNYPAVFWVDYMGLFARIGSIQSMDLKHWYLSKAPFGKAATNALVLEYAKFFKSFLGKSKKCLVLDCDNTLWGGIIGEDGSHGIKLGNSFPGQIYKDFQSEILNLYQRGIILAICSKNNEQDVIEVLENHPDMVLKKKHLATWQINWEDKATNLKRIANDLNIGIDSLVFVDDNPFECNLIREKLPEVTVVELGKDVISIKHKLESLGLFDTLFFSSEDKKRNEMYHLEKERKVLLSTSDSIEDYLNSLELEASFGKVSEAQIGRVAQLAQKTNQFNLTTKRYTDAEIKKFSQSENSEVYYIQLKDKISDLGIIGLAIVHFEHDKALIDSFLLSCRALGRGVEETLLALILNRASLRACKLIQGKYIETAKNAQVKDFYKKREFKLLKEESGKTIWELDLYLAKKDYPAWIKNNPSNQLEIYASKGIKK